MKERFEMILLDVHHRCSAARQLKHRGGCSSTGCSLRINHVVHRDVQAVRLAEAINLSRLMNTSKSVVRMDRSFLSVVREVLNYVEAFELQYGVLCAEARMKGIVDDMMPLKHLPKQSRLLYKDT